MTGGLGFLLYNSYQARQLDAPSTLPAFTLHSAPVSSVGDYSRRPSAAQFNAQPAGSQLASLPQGMGSYQVRSQQSMHDWEKVAEESVEGSEEGEPRQVVARHLTFKE